MDTQAIKSSIMPQVVLFDLNCTSVLYRSDGIEFSIIRDTKNDIFFLAKNENSIKRRKFTKRPYTPDELMNAFIEFIFSFLDDSFKDVPLAE